MKRILSTSLLVLMFSLGSDANSNLSLQVSENIVISNTKKEPNFEELRTVYSDYDNTKSGKDISWSLQQMEEKSLAYVNANYEKLSISCESVKVKINYRIRPQQYEERIQNGYAKYVFVDGVAKVFCKERSLWQMTSLSALSNCKVNFSLECAKLLQDQEFKKTIEQIPVFKIFPTQFSDR